MNTVISSTLARAKHEELVMRHLVRLPRFSDWERQTGASRTNIGDTAPRSGSDPLHAAFALLLIYSLQPCEVLGLRWGDVGEAAMVLRIRQEIQRTHGRLCIRSIKDPHGCRDLCLVRSAVEILSARAAVQAADRQRADGNWQRNDLIFTTQTGLPIDPHSMKVPADEAGLTLGDL
jgi:hypothetical protein